MSLSYFLVANLGFTKSLLFEVLLTRIFSNWVYIGIYLSFRWLIVICITLTYKAFIHNHSSMEKISGPSLSPLYPVLWLSVLHSCPWWCPVTFGWLTQKGTPFQPFCSSLRRHRFCSSLGQSNRSHCIRLSFSSPFTVVLSFLSELYRSETLGR